MTRHQRMTREGPVLEIRMQDFEATCSLCGCATAFRWSVPTYQGDLVSNDFPDGECFPDLGNQPVCEHCFRMHAGGKFRTYDHLYVPRLLCQGLVDGAGI